MKAGDYVRTKNLGGSIEKIIEIISKERTVDGKERYLTDISSTFSIMIEEQDIIKSSPNIIDLIEVGDYVNGYLVEKIYQPINKEIGKLIEFSTDNVSGWEYEAEEIRENDIKSIVTKEQFESMEYKVGE